MLGFLSALKPIALGFKAMNFLYVTMIIKCGDRWLKTDKQKLHFQLLLANEWYIFH